jgi:hypothetical protein
MSVWTNGRFKLYWIVICFIQKKGGNKYEIIGQQIRLIDRFCDKNQKEHL